MAPHEPPALGAVIICGQCGSLMILDWVPLDEHLEDAGDDGVGLRRPTDAEGKLARRDPAVVAALDAFNVVTLEGMTTAKGKGDPGRLPGTTKRVIQRRRLRRMTLGPDGDGFITAALVSLLAVPFACLAVGFFVGFIEGARFHP